MGRLYSRYQPSRDEERQRSRLDWMIEWGLLVILGIMAGVLVWWMLAY